MEPRTSHGQMVSYYLKMEPHLFRAAVEDQFARIRAERDAAAAAAKEQAQEAQPEKSELVLYRRARLFDCLLNKVFGNCAVFKATQNYRSADHRLTAGAHYSRLSPHLLALLVFFART